MLFYIFAALAIVSGAYMVLTRKLDWYGVGKRKAAEPLQFDLEAV